MVLVERETRATARGRSNLGGDHQCPCTGAVWVFTRPSSGWSGTIVASPALPVSGSAALPSVALEDQDLFVSGTSTVDVYRLTGAFGQTARPAALTQALASGLSRDRPQLSFRLSADASVTPLGSFTLGLPSGLSFTHSRTQLTHGVVISGSKKYSISLRDGQLTVLLRASAARLTVTIHRSALLETQALIKRITSATRIGPVTRLRFRLSVRQALGVAHQWWLPSQIVKKMTFRITVT